MFDDPRRKLKWMEQELLRAEEYDEVYDEFGVEFDTGYDGSEDDDLLYRVDQLTAEPEEFEEDFDEDFQEDLEAAPVRNFANNYGRQKTRAQEYSRTVFADEEFDEDAAVVVQRRKKEKLPKNRRVKGLVFLACLELLGILAVMGWWLRWLI